MIFKGNLAAKYLKYSFSTNCNVIDIVNFGCRLLLWKFHTSLKKWTTSLSEKKKMFYHVGVLVNIKMEHQVVNIHYGFFLYGETDIQDVKSCLSLKAHLTW